ncbi:MAG TPA: 4-demethylwyosine synthase TYW1 [Candidatus Poseidoniia archaeon]|jgi:tRNA wybutosine-synthesizing protein 1|nr:4-demethylwyosine synthase TYW1 [Candidatus Poseidoniia archaeon]|tara:strand:+ start:585 stop:1622 length:1038 start_codon:yes stop_codon:yes gene_type:complete
MMESNIEEGNLLFTDEYKKALEKASYEIVGNHSAVEICGWTKKSLKGDSDGCYKQKFYGIRSHQCTQMTPAAVACDQKCVYCWRANEMFSGRQDLMEYANDDPVEVVQESIEAHLRKLTGFGGNPKIDQNKYEESRTVRHFAISLTGEPTLYKRLPGMLRELRRRKISSFLVTNGLHPEMIERLRDEDSLPTQLYMSLDAPDEATWKKIDIPLIPNFWDKIRGTLKLMDGLKTRKVLRMTIVKGWNDFDIPGYADLIRLAGEQVMIEVKSYMHLGPARKRLSQDNMLSYEEVSEFSNNIASELGWKVIDEAPNSLIALVAEEDWDGRVMDFGNPLTGHHEPAFSC